MYTVKPDNNITFTCFFNFIFQVNLVFDMAPAWMIWQASVVGLTVGISTVSVHQFLARLYKKSTFFKEKIVPFLHLLFLFSSYLCILQTAVTSQLLNFHSPLTVRNTDEKGQKKAVYPPTDWATRRGPTSNGTCLLLKIGPQSYQQHIAYNFCVEQSISESYGQVKWEPWHFYQEEKITFYYRKTHSIH